jgi:hypothetical protein
MITEEWAREAVQCASMLAAKAEVPLRDVELWLEHVAPVIGRPEMVDGWRAWAAEMDAEGPLDATLEEVEDRVLDGFFGKGWRTGLEPRL